MRNFVRGHASAGRVPGGATRSRSGTSAPQDTTATTDLQVTAAEWFRATDEPPRAAFKGIRWSVSFVALIVYLFVIVSYQISIGDAAMIIALIGLLVEPGGMRAPALLLLLGAMVAWGFVGWVFSPWSAVVYPNLEVMWKLTLITLVAASTLTDRPRIRLFMLAFVFFYALYPARGTLVNYFVAGYTVWGRAVWSFIYRNSNDLAALTLLQLSLATGLLVTEKNRWFRKGALAAVVVLTLIILLTQSRGGFLGLLAFGLLAFWGEKKKGRAAAVLAIIGVAGVLLVPESAWERFGMLKTLGTGGTTAFEELDDQGSAEQRWQIWQTSLRITGDNPITGVGIGAYNQANATYSPALGTRDTHSTYLNVLAETGIPGLMIFLAVIAAALVPAERVRRRIKELRPRSARQLYLLELGLVGYLVAGIFASYARLTFLYLHLVILWALAAAHARELRTARQIASGEARG